MEEQIKTLREPWLKRFTRHVPLGPQALGEKEWRHPDTLFDILSWAGGTRGVQLGSPKISTFIRSYLTRRPDRIPPLTPQQKIEGLRRGVRQASPHYKGEGYEVSKAQWERVQKAIERMRGE